MSDLAEELKNFGFEKKGDIILNGTEALPEFKFINPPLDTYEGHVYLWVIEKNGIPFKIVYIGKAGKTLIKRFNQHKNGFKSNGGSKKGLSNGVELLNFLRKDTKIAFYARQSQRIEILGQPNVSLCDAEENALISYYKKDHPLFNKI